MPFELSEWINQFLLIVFINRSRRPGLYKSIEENDPSKYRGHSSYDFYASFTELGHTYAAYGCKALICKIALNSCQYRFTTAYYRAQLYTAWYTLMYMIIIVQSFYSDFIEHGSILCNRMSISWRHLQTVKSNQFGCNQSKLQRPEWQVGHWQ